MKNILNILIMTSLISIQSILGAGCGSFLKSFLKDSSNADIIRKAKASDLAKLIAVDEETRTMIANPAIAQYVFVNYFAKHVGAEESEAALRSIVDSYEAKDVDLFKLVNETLAEKLNDPTVQKRVASAFEDGDDINLRPSMLRRSSAKKLEGLRQASGLFGLIRKLKNHIKEGMSQDKMDRNLFDFYGATQLGLKDSQLRKWDLIEGSYSAIRPDQITGISPNDWNKIAMFASETEAPIHGYSTNSGEVLRGIFPVVGSFMGKDAEQFDAYTKRHFDLEMQGKEEDMGPFCTNVWCSEEQRHEFALDMAAERVTGVKVPEEKTFESDVVGDFSDVDYAIKHLLGRNASEWSANATYFLLGAHAKGPAHTWIENVRRDETKHLAIFATIFKYIYGPRPFLRTKGMMKHLLVLAKQHKETNTNGNVLSEVASTFVTGFEMMVSHIIVESQVQKYVKTVPYKTMRKFFENPARTIKDVDATAMSPEKKDLLDQVVDQEKTSRRYLRRWSPVARRRYTALNQVEEEHSDLIEGLVTGKFKSFKGAEIVGSQSEKDILAEIKNVSVHPDSKTNNLIQMSLRETLRDYQIMNNNYVRSLEDFVVKFKSAAEGFIVVPKVEGQAFVNGVKEITDNTFMVKVAKPLELDEDIVAGEAFKITIDTPEGPEWRIFSLSNSPESEVLEFSVTASNSAFKEAFRSLNVGSTVVVERLNMGLDFDMSKPMVMLAGGIGVTPFRSIIQQVVDKKLDTSMQLIYGNRTSIPFKDEIDLLASENSNFSVVHSLSKPDQNWKGAKGRISEQLLKEQSFPTNANFYVVGTPGMISDMEKHLFSLGISEGQIFKESFGESPSTHQTPVQVNAQSEAPIPNLRPAKETRGEDNKVVCHCQSVTIGQINAAIAAGQTSLSGIQTATGAGNGCGGCHKRIEALLKP